MPENPFQVYDLTITWLYAPLQYLSSALKFLLAPFDWVVDLLSTTEYNPFGNALLPAVVGSTGWLSKPRYASLHMPISTCSFRAGDLL